MFNATFFRLDQPAKFIYPDSRTNEPKLRKGIVKEVGAAHIKLEHTNEQGATVTKSFNYTKMQPSSE